MESLEAAVRPTYFRDVCVGGLSAIGLFAKDFNGRDQHFLWVPGNVTFPPSDNDSEKRKRRAAGLVAKIWLNHGTYAIVGPPIDQRASSPSSGVVISKEPNSAGIYIEKSHHLDLSYNPGTKSFASEAYMRSVYGSSFEPVFKSALEYSVHI